MSVIYKLLPSEANKISANAQRSLMICSFFEKNVDGGGEIEEVICWIRSRVEKVMMANNSTVLE